MKISKINILITIIIISFLISFFIIYKINKNVIPIVSEYSINKIHNYTTGIINETIYDLFDEDDELVHIEKDADGVIRLIDYDYAKINKKLSILSSNIIDKINKNDSNIYYVSLGNITGNVFLSNIGPKIPIKLNATGYVISNISSEVVEYGINNALVKININVEVSEEIIMPFLNEKTKTSLKIPLSIKNIEGSIPKYYGGKISDQSNIFSIPIDENL